MADDLGQSGQAKEDALHRLMVERMPGVVWSTDRQLRFTASFGAGLAALGLEPDEVVGTTLYELFQTEDEDFAPIAAHRRALAGQSATFELSWKGRTFQTCTEPLADEQGRVVGCIGVAHDVTEWKRAEAELRRARDEFDQRVQQRTAELGAANAELRAIYDGMVDGVLIADLETKRFIRANPAICRMLGYSEEELLALSVTDIHPPEHLPKVLEEFQAQADGRLVLAEDSPVLRKDGTAFPADIGAAPVVYRGRRCNIGFFRDTTKRKRAEEALRKEQRVLRQLLESHERERKLVAYEIHDGLAQQLTAATMQLQAFQISREQNPEAAAKALDAGMSLLGQSVTETRRLISGLRPPILDEQGVVPAIEHLVHETGEPEGPAVELVVNVRFGRLHPLLENAIFRIVQESLTNARRHSQSDQVRIELTQKGSRLHIEVRDWGIGFDPEGVGDRGFGLRGVRERARVLGGKVSVHSAPGKGTRLTAVLSLAAR